MPSHRAGIAVLCKVLQLTVPVAVDSRRVAENVIVIDSAEQGSLIGVSATLTHEAGESLITSQ
jgi:hypothetical protein